MMIESPAADGTGKAPLVLQFVMSPYVADVDPVNVYVAAEAVTPWARITTPVKMRNATRFHTG